MQDASKYLKWEDTGNGVRVTGCDSAFEGAWKFRVFLAESQCAKLARRRSQGAKGLKSYAWERGLTGIKSIEKGAFAECVSLKSVDIPDSVEVVDEKDLPVFRFARNRRRVLFASPSSTNESLKYLEWEIAWNGARITDCDTNFKGALEIPTLIGGIEVVEICEHASSIATKSPPSSSPIRSNMSSQTPIATALSTALPYSPKEP